MTFVFRENFFAEISFKVFADNENDFAEACFDCVIDLIVHDSFAVRTETIKLFQASITAAHAGSEYK
jgi:hypothetical protein